MNFLSGQLSAKGTVGKKAWDWGIAQGYSPQQVKVAVQQLARSGVGVNPFLKGAANKGPGVRGNPMRGVPGMGSADGSYINPGNPLGRFQGGGGNLGLKAYNRAKEAGYDIANIPMLAAQGGMFLPPGAQAQWEADMSARYAPPEDPEWEMPGTHMGGGAVLGTSAAGVRSKIGSQDNTGGTQDAFGREKSKINTLAAQLSIDPLG